MFSWKDTVHLIECNFECAVELHFSFNWSIFLIFSFVKNEYAPHVPSTYTGCRTWELERIGDYPQKISERMVISYLYRKCWVFVLAYHLLKLFQYHLKQWQQNMEISKFWKVHMAREKIFMTNQRNQNFDSFKDEMMVFVGRHQVKWLDILRKVLKLNKIFEF